MACYIIFTKCKRLKTHPNIARIPKYLECLLISVDLLGTGGSCVPFRVGVGDCCDIGENGTISKMSVEGDFAVTLPACNEDRNQCDVPCSHIILLRMSYTCKTHKHNPEVSQITCHSVSEK